MASLLKNLALPFDSSKTYKFGDRFISGGHMYQVMESFNGSLDMTKVIEVTLADLVKGGYPPYESFAGISVEAASVSSDDENTYFGIPKPGFYNEQSKIFTSNSNLKQINIQKIICSQRMGDIQCNVFLSLDTKDLNYFSFEKFSWSNCGFLYARITDANNNVIKSFAYGDTNVIVDISSYDSIYIGMGSFNANVDYAQLIMHNIKVY